MICTLTSMRPLRLLALATATLAALAGPGTLSAQTLPPTPPTSLANPNSLPAPIAGAPTGGNTVQHHRARVTYANGLLDVRADNSSLNQILRDISRQTGMQIVGGVADQRIFGNYGPAAPTTVLQTLLDGTGTNMLLKENANEGPAELVLTPQTAGATPPSPNSASYDATETEPDLPVSQPVAIASPATAPSRSTLRPAVAAPASTAAASAASTATPSTAPSSLPPVMPQPLNNVNGSQTNVSPSASTIPTVHSVPTDSLPTPSTAPSATGIVDAPNPPPAGSTTAGFTGQTPPDNNPNLPPTTNAAGQSSNTTSTPSNGQKTPQQVYQELLQMQQKQSQPQQTPPSPQTPVPPQTPQTTPAPQ
jgi:hypothetical protein